MERSIPIAGVPEHLSVGRIQQRVESPGDQARRLRQIEIVDKQLLLPIGDVGEEITFGSDQAGGGTVVFTDWRCIILSWKASSFG